MTTIAVSMVRNELDVIDGCVRHMAGEVDALIVADNGSTDGTRDVLDQLAGELPLTVLDDPDPAYYQSAKMTALADRAGAAGATWVVPFDADEVWYSPHGPIRDALALAAGNVAPAVLYNHWGTAVDPAGADPFRTMRWRDAKPGTLPKVAFRWRPGATIHQGNHGVDIPGPVHRAEGVLQLRHFPYRSAAQFVSKARQGAAAYRATTLPTSMGAHWRLYGQVLDEHGPEALEDHYRRYFWRLVPVDAGMVEDPAPYRRWER